MNTYEVEICALAVSVLEYEAEDEEAARLIAEDLWFGPDDISKLSGYYVRSVKRAS